MKKQILLTVICLFSLLTANAQFNQDSIGTEPYMKFLTPYYLWLFPSESAWEVFEYDDVKFVYDKETIILTDSSLTYTWKINGETFCNTENPIFIFIPTNKVPQLIGDSVTTTYANTLIKVACKDLQLIQVTDTFRIDIYVEGTFNGKPLKPIQTYWNGVDKNTTLGFYHGTIPLKDKLTSIPTIKNSYDSKKEYFDLFGNKTIAEGLVIEKQNNVYKKKFIVK